MSDKKNSGPELDPLIPLTPEAADYHQNKFLVGAEKRLKNANHHPTTIFFCGPNEQDNPVTRKRYETINSLIELGFDVFTGEKIVEELRAKDQQAGRVLKTPEYYERIAALESDLIVILRASPGSIGEFHEFVNDRELRHKLLVCADNAHSGGYSSTGSLTTLEQQYSSNVIHYDCPKDLTECYLKTKIIERAEVWRHAKFLFESGWRG